MLLSTHAKSGLLYAFFIYLFFKTVLTPSVPTSHVLFYMSHVMCDILHITLFLKKCLLSLNPVGGCTIINGATPRNFNTPCVAGLKKKLN